MPPTLRSDGIRSPTAALLLAMLLVGTIGAVFLLGGTPSPSDCRASPTISDRTSTPVHHLFLIIKENHAFENYFATYPGVIGSPPTGVFPVSYNGNATITPHPLAGTSTPDLPHDRGSEIADLNGGRNDLFVAQAERQGAVSPTDAVGYYTETQVAPYFALARSYTLDDMFFSGVLGPTLPNRIFDLAGTTGGWTSDELPPSANLTFPTILDQLSAAGIRWNYDYSGSSNNLTPILFPAIAGSPCALAEIRPVGELEGQLRSATPPAVTFVDPSHDPSVSEHPPQNVTLGAEWTISVLQTIFSSPIASSSAAFVFYDEAGGFWDPVVPPSIDPLGDGFRVPFFAVSPWSPANRISHLPLDAASVLRFIDENWDLPPLNPRVSAAPSLTPLFDFAMLPRPYAGPTSSVPLVRPGIDGAADASSTPAEAGFDGRAPPPTIPAAVRWDWETTESLWATRRVRPPWPKSGYRNTTRSRCSSNRGVQSWRSR